MRPEYLRTIADELALDLAYAGTCPAPELYDALNALGKDGVGALVSVLEQDLADSSMPWIGVVHVAEMLAYLGATSAIPVICDEFRLAEDVKIEQLAMVLGAMGAPAVGPCLDLACDEELSWPQRSVAFDAARMAAAGDQQALDTIRDRMAAQLREFIGRRGSLQEGEIEFASILVGDLATFQKAEDRALLDQAFGAGITDDLIVTRRAVRDIYAGRTEPEQLADARAFIRSQVEQCRETYARTLNRWKSRAFLLRHDTAPERNDPCWCGSGRGYRKCHMAADRRSVKELRSLQESLLRLVDAASQKADQT